MKLYKTTIVIWSADAIAGAMELDTLASEATYGSSHCSKIETVEVLVPNADPGWDGTEFFELWDDEP